MKRKLGVVMDPIGSINRTKDSTYKMLLEAEKRNFEIFYMEQSSLFIRDGVCFASAQRLTFDPSLNPPKSHQLAEAQNNWYQLSQTEVINLGTLDVVLMRKDPPFDMEYIYTTHQLDLAERDGCLVVNAPGTLRNTNEKLLTQHFTECCAPTLVTRTIAPIKNFLEEHQDIIVKPLDGMGGASIFRLQQGDPNTNVILETITQHQKETVMAQKYIPEITEGDKRILLVDGEPVPYALARIPAQGESRGNLAAGGTGRAQPLTDRDRWIAEQIAPFCKDNGLLFVGLDVIGDYVTEINVTSPTCVQEIDNAYGTNIAGDLFDAIEKRLK
ncbi:MAG: glutathione synthase [Pseudomonadota bacterium]